MGRGSNRKKFFRKYSLFSIFPTQNQKQPHSKVFLQKIPEESNMPFFIFGARMAKSKNFDCYLLGPYFIFSGHPKISTCYGSHILHKKSHLLVCIIYLSSPLLGFSNTLISLIIVMVVFLVLVQAMVSFMSPVFSDFIFMES